MIEGDDLPPLPLLTTGTRITGSAIAGWGIPLESKKRENVAVVDCPFGYIYNDDGDKILRGGVVTGGVTNHVAGSYTLNMASGDGTWVWLSVSFTANSADGVLLAGVATVNSTSYASGASIPNNTIPTALSPNGIIKVPIGYYQDGQFIPLGCGNVNVNHCPGYISSNRAV
jgi:hypothetical protein